MDIHYRPVRYLPDNKEFQIRLDQLLKLGQHKSKDNNQRFDDTAIFSHLMMQRGEAVIPKVEIKTMRPVNISSTSLKFNKFENEKPVEKGGSPNFKISSSKHFSFNQVGGARKMLGVIAANALLKQPSLTKLPTSISGYKKKQPKDSKPSQSWLETRKLSLPKI